MENQYKLYLLLVDFGLRVPMDGGRGREDCLLFTVVHTRLTPRARSGQRGNSGFKINPRKAIPACIVRCEGKPLP